MKHLFGAIALVVGFCLVEPTPALAAPGKTLQAGPEIMLHASNAITHAVMMRYEPPTNKNCLGYWTEPKDWAEWPFTVTQPGTYEVELWQGCGRGQGGSEVSLQVADTQFSFLVEETGHFQNFLHRKLGRVELKAGDHSLAVRPRNKRAAAVMDIRALRLFPVTAAQAAPPKLQPLVDSRRVVFVGDSITYAGEYIEFVETWLRAQFPDATCEFITLGLPSETLSGLSEPGHAGGSFPRPNLHERLARLLEKAKPDLVFACYGMNDGIYHPLSEERFRKFQEGMRKLRETAIASGAKVIHVTPPTFDAVPLKGHTLPAGLPEYRSPYEGYNEVLDRYSEWLVAQGREQGWEVIDIHAPMNQFLAEQRRANPEFRLAGDGVHANTQGHWLISREILRHLGAADTIVASTTPETMLGTLPNAEAILKLVQKEQRLLKDAWLNEVGHLRPGMGKGKPVDEALSTAAEIRAEIQKLAK